jgi:hypothetical protein
MSIATTLIKRLDHRSMSKITRRRVGKGTAKPAGHYHYASRIMVTKQDWVSQK